MIENFIRNMPDDEVIAILKKSGVRFIGNGMIELNSSETFGGTTRYKKTISLERYIEEIVDEITRKRVANQFEEKFKNTLTSEIKGKVRNWTS